MKKIIILLLISLVYFNVDAQRKAPVSASTDTLQGAETVYFPVVTTTGPSNLTLQFLFTEVGGTSDGTFTLEGSIDNTSWETIIADGIIMSALPNDTFTIVDGGVVDYILLKSPFKYYRGAGVGTSGDTTLVTPKYLPW